MLLSERAALQATTALLAVSLTLQSGELLLVRRALRDDGVFAWPVLRDELASWPAPLRWLADGLLRYRSFVALLTLQLGLALALSYCEHALVPLALLVITLLVCIRFRGTYNGGSDAMTVVVLFGVLLARLPESLGSHGTHGALASLAARAGLGYIAAQLLLSYALAGLSKLREPRWRTGRALPRLLHQPQYAVPAGLLRLLARRPVALAASWLLIAFECGFPLALALGPVGCGVLLALGLSFHAVNAYALGLNRFVWAWLAAYPALLFWSGQLD